MGAVIVREGLVLAAQRGERGPLAGLWEFPGGKIEPGETPAAALTREIREELRCEVAVGDAITTTSHQYDFGIVDLSTFYCELRDGTPQPVEHAALAWLDPGTLTELAWAPADIPAVSIIANDFDT